MTINGGKQESRVRMLGLTAVVLVAAGILFLLLGPLTEFGTAVFGAILLGLGVLLGIVAVVMNAFRR